MRIALVAPLPPLRGGIAHHATSLAEALRRGGHDVRGVSYRRQYPRLLFPGASERDEGQAPLPFPVIHPLTSLGPLRWLEGARALRAYGPDLLIVAWWNAGLIGPVSALLLSARASGVPSVLLAHNVSTHEGGARAVLDDVAWAAFAELADGVLVHGAGDATRLQSRHPRLTIRAHPHPRYDRFLKARRSRAAARERLGLAHSDEVALCLGNVRPYKGVDVALRAFAQARRERPRLQLVVAGEVYGGARREIEAALRAIAPVQAVLTDRYVSDDELGEYASAADVLLAPHRQASHSGVVQVAKAFGLPVIASRVGGLPELLDDTDVLVPPGDVPALGRAISAFFARGQLPPPEPLGLLEVQREWDSLAAAVLELAKVSSGA